MHSTLPSLSPGDGTGESSDAQAWKRQDRRYHERPEVAATYDRRVSRFYRLDHRRYTLDPWGHRMLEAGTRTVLDFGCGSGLATLRYLDLGLDVIAMDASLAMVVQVRARARRAGHKALYVVADGDHLPFRDGALDAVSCTGVLHHMPNIASAVGSQIRVLKAGGLLFASEPYNHRPWFSRPGQLLFDVIKGLRDGLRERLRGASPGARERPLGRHDVAEARVVLDAAGLDHRVICFTYWPYVCGVLPLGMAWFLMRCLDRLKPAERGDAVRIEARRRSVETKLEDNSHD